MSAATANAAATVSPAVSPALGVVHGVAIQSEDAAPARRSLLRSAFSQRTWFISSTGLIGLGSFMLMQPFSIDLYSYSFVVLLAGVLGFTIAGKLPK